MFRKALALACAALIGGCAVGAPPGFSSGNKWAFPLVAPLENTPLLVPVMINGKGPYLFAIDPDSPVSMVDSAIKSELKLYTVRGPEIVDERDKRVNTGLAEVQTITLGSLKVRNKKFRVIMTGRYWINGRLVRGVIGRDIIADSLIFAYDRDKGMGYLATQGHMPPPSDSIKLGYRRFNNRKLVPAVINNKHKVELHMDLGGPVSMLWPAKIKKLHLPQLRVQATSMDEAGTIHRISGGTLIGILDVKGKVKSHGVYMLAYNDKRMNEVDLDGTLGQNFLKGHNLMANWHKTTFYLTPRDKDLGAHAAERLRRWGPAFDKCKNTACVDIKVVAANAKPPGATTPQPTPPGTTPPVDPKQPEAKKADPPSVTATPNAGMPAPPSHNLRVTREAMTIGDYEVLVQAMGKDGKPLAQLQPLLVTLPKGVPVVQWSELPAGYEQAASFRVLDLSPFPRKCQMSSSGQRQCVWPLRPVK